jgi:hypothetical protein
VSHAADWAHLERCSNIDVLTSDLRASANSITSLPPRTPTPPVHSSDHDMVPVDETTPTSRPNHVPGPTIGGLRTPHRQPLRDLGFTVPIVGQPRTPIRPSSTRKFLIGSPRSPVTPSRPTPARSVASQPLSVHKSPVREEWVDNVETLATWSPAKFESYYTMQQTFGAGTSLRKAFEETLRKDATVPVAIARKEGNRDIGMFSDGLKPATPSPQNQPSSDSAAHSDSAGAKGSLRSETSSVKDMKRKVPGSEDDTVSTKRPPVSK